MTQNTPLSHSHSYTEKFNQLKSTLNLKNINIYPLSIEQESLWVENSLLEASEKDTFVEISSFRVDGEIEFERLKEAFLALVKRHPTGRSQFELINGTLVQIIKDFDPQTNEIGNFYDLSSMAQNEADAFYKKSLKNVLDIEVSVMDFIVFKLSDKNYKVVLFAHHIICDHITSIKTIDEVFSLYEKSELESIDFTQIEADCVPEDYVLDRRETQLNDNEAKEYWTKQLGTEFDSVDLLQDFPHPSKAGGKGGLIISKYEDDDYKNIKAVSKQLRATPFILLSSLFHILLHKLSQADQIAMSVAFSVRDKQTQDELSYFINSLPMISEIKRDESFKSFIDDMKKVNKSTSKVKNYPFSEVNKLFSYDRSLAFHPLQRYSTTYTHYRPFSKEFKNSTFTFEPIRKEEASGFDFSVVFVDNGENISAEFNYNKDIFKQTTADAMVTKFRRLFNQVIQNPEILIQDLSVLSVEEKQEQFVLYNQTEVKYDKTKTIHQLFEEQVERTPNDIATVFENKELSYKELNIKANQLAHYLIQEGIKADDLVGICVERSLEMMIGLLGVLKAGGAYIPIDPSYPSDRIQYLIEDSKAKILLTQKSLKPSLPKTDASQVCIDTLNVDNYSLNNPITQTTAKNLVYVIYTSGTTGKPKGVMLEHGGVVNRLDWMQEKFNIDKTDKVIQKTPYSFDVSVWELFWPLLCGSTQIIAKPEGHKDTDYLISLIKEHEISTIHFVPSMLSVILENPRFKETHSLQQIICSGEALSLETVKEHYKHSDTPIYNLYGPTEASIDVSCYDCLKDDLSIPIGRPINNIELYILDKNNKLVTKGVAGELHIAGDGLARGYLNQDELTNEKFISNPFTPDTKMYKTGDLVKYAQDGNIQYLGRIDDQVKIRGFRIELGEIEEGLLNIKGIKEAVVLAKVDDLNNKKLVAYITTKESLESEAIKGALSKHLIEYMIPSLIQTLDTMPLTPNGKVDKKALLKLDVQMSSKHEYIAPRNKTEEVLVKIFTEVLEVEKVGIYDNFFDLGGHSLLATSLVSKIRKELEIELPLKELFTHASVEGLGQYLKEKAVKTTLSEITVMEDKSNIALSFAQERLWFLDKLEEGSSSTYHMPGLLKLEGTLNKEALQRALQTIVERHEVLRTNFINKENIVKQVIGSADKFTLMQIECSEEALPDKVQISLSQGFDLSSDFLFRASLFETNKTENYLLINMHHIISDGWSIGLLIKEFISLYSAYTNSEENPLAPLSIQYADYSAWQKDYLSADVLNEKLSFWKEELEGSENLELPTTYSRPSEPSYRGNTINFEIDKSLTNSLNLLNKKHGTTLFMSLLSSFSLLLHRYTAQDDILIGTPIANRNRTEVEDLIGFFVNTLVMRQDYSAKPNFKELLTQVKEKTLSAYEQQDVPFEKIVDFLNIPRDASRSPLFQVMFILQNNENVKLELPELSISTQELSSDISKYDLTLNISEENDVLQGSIEYATDLFSKDYIESMIENFKVLLEAIVEDDTKVVSQYALLTQAQETEQLLDYNQTKVDYDKTKTMYELFEEQVEKTPNSIAVSYENEELSYAALNAKANALAHYLIEEGVEADSLVAICVERSLEMMVGLLAILKAGGAYVPVDPSYPSDRIQYMIEDSNAKILLTQQSLQEKLPQTNNKQIVLDTLDLSSYKSTNPSTKTGVNNLAYVIYTSGSTGKPKGVMIEHFTLVNFLLSMQKTPGLKATDTLLALTPISFDIHTLELYLPLISGAHLSIASRIMSITPNLLAQEIQDKNISIMQATPATWTMLLNDNWKPEQKLSILCGGEAISDSLKEGLLSLDGVSLHNMYGPTETTVWSSTTQLNSDTKTYIGSPINNTQFYILDKTNQIVPKGVPGELHIAGDGLARGYLHQAALSDEKFISNPFTANERMYKTGDLVRYLEDGNIEYLGRIDDQVKIRGFRIELGEIEQELLSISNIKEAVVLAKMDENANKNLVAYITTKDNLDVELSVMKSALSQNLPAFMIPSAMTRLEAMPLTPNAKIDKKALMKIEVKIASKEEYVAPRNELEESLASIFCEVLSLEKVGIYDNFFDLGGHSLLATQLVSKIRTEVGIDLPLKSLFEVSTIEGLAEFIHVLKGNIDYELEDAQDMEFEEGTL